MDTVFDKPKPATSRRSSKDLGDMLVQNLARIGWHEMQFIAAGGEGNIYQVPVYFVQDGEEKTRWCVLKKSKSEHNHSLAKEEDFNYLLTQADESSINHHIIKLIAHIDTPSGSYSLYPYCDLILNQLINVNDQTSPFESLKASTPLIHTALIVKVGTDILKAMFHMHQSGVVHRDIKLLNIGYHLGRWCLLDWGLATNLINEYSSPSEDVTLAGTVPYIHPKSFLEPGFSSTWHNDVYALGRVLQFLMNKKIFVDTMNTFENPLQMGYHEMMRFKKNQKNFPDEVPDFEANCPSITYDDGRQALQYLIDKMISLNPAEQPTLHAIKQKLSTINVFIRAQLDIQNLDLDEELDNFHQHLIDSRAKKETISDPEVTKSSDISPKPKPMVSSTFFTSDSSSSFFSTSSTSSELSDTTREMVTSNDECANPRLSIAN